MAQSGGEETAFSKSTTHFTLHGSSEQLLIISPKAKPLPTNCFPFRQRAPFNTDVKNGRSEHVLPRLVCLEQTGFAEGRQSTDNMLSLPNVLGTSGSQTGGTSSPPLFLVELSPLKGELQGFVKKRKTHSQTKHAGLRVNKGKYVYKFLRPLYPWDQSVLITKALRLLIF